MDASRRAGEPQCPDFCGPVHVKGVRKEDITCPCGYGYYSKKTGEFISGDLVRAGKAPPKDADEITVPKKCWNDPARGGRDGQVHELPGHKPLANGPPLSSYPKGARSSSPDLITSRSMIYDAQSNPQQPYSTRISERHDPSPGRRRPTHERWNISDQPPLATNRTHNLQTGRGLSDRYTADSPPLADYGPDDRHSPPRRYDEQLPRSHKPLRPNVQSYDREGDDHTSILTWIPSHGIEFDVISNDIQTYLGPDASVERAEHPKDGRPGYFVRGALTLTVPMITDLKRDSISWLDERRDLESKDYKSSQTHKLRRLKNSSPSDPPLPQPSSNFQLSRKQLIRHAPDMNSTPRSSSTSVSVPQEPGERGSLPGHRQETIPSAPQRDDHDRFNDSRRDVEARVARRLKGDGETRITRAQLDRLVNQEMQRLQSTSISTDTVRKHR